MGTPPARHPALSWSRAAQGADGWGYEDEALTRASMARKIDAAADHGIGHLHLRLVLARHRSVFANCALDEGFLGACEQSTGCSSPSCGPDHDWIDLFPAPVAVVPVRRVDAALSRVNARTFREATDHVIEHYFKHPSYWKIDGCPYFSVYELATLIGGLGGVPEARAALDDFRAAGHASGSGFPDLHLNAIVWGVQIASYRTGDQKPRERFNWPPWVSTAFRRYVWTCITTRLAAVPRDTL